MSGILSGLESLGLGNISTTNLYETQEKPKEGPVAPVVVEEKDILFDRTFSCPVCDHKYAAKALRTGKAKLLSTDMDLRPKYEGIDPVKYDVALCPECGYTVLTRFFGNLTNNQLKAVKENITPNVKIPTFQGEIYTYEEAMERYKLALACAIVKQSKASEKAYICMKTAWLLRGYAEKLEADGELTAEKKAAIEAQEQEYLKNAFEGFVAGRQNEGFPICGMDEITIDYLISVLAYEIGKLDVASKLVAGILVNPAANPRMKDKARDVKDLILAKLKK